MGVAEASRVSINDAVLVQQWQSGDLRAMERLILKYQNRIYNVIQKICANADDAAELTQETFVKIIENIGKFEHRSSFYTWAFRIAVNLTLNYCHRRAKLGMGSIDVQTDDEGRLSLRDILANEASPEPGQIAENAELCELVVRALLRLDDEHRAVIVLRDIENMSYADISSVLNVELGTVKSRISRARSRLRDILESSLQ
jgi:RNA polymerase sigma-70 factor (ECF subfamily)